MNTPTILVAKYTPNLERMEPRNAGVIVWSPENVSAIFLGELPDGKIMRPSMVPKNEGHAYKEWIRYWRIMLGKDSVRNNAGKLVNRSSPDFVELLMSKSKSSFALVDAGFMMSHVAASEIQEVAHECFDYLVTDNAPAHIVEHKRALRGAIKEVMEIAGVRERDDFRKRIPIKCRFSNVPKDLVFDFGLGNDKVPWAVFQGVMLPEDRSVFHATLMFSKLRHTKRLKAIDRSAFILATSDTEISDEAHANLEILKFNADVIDVSDVEAAAKVVRRKAS